MKWLIMKVSVTYRYTTVQLWHEWHNTSTWSYGNGLWSITCIAGTFQFFWRIVVARLFAISIRSSFRRACRRTRGEVTWQVKGQRSKVQEMKAWRWGGRGRGKWAAIMISVMDGWRWRVGLYVRGVRYRKKEREGGKRQNMTLFCGDDTSRSVKRDE